MSDYIERFYEGWNRGYRKGLEDAAELAHDVISRLVHVNGYPSDGARAVEEKILAKIKEIQ